MIYSSTADAFAVVNNTVSLRWVSLLTRGLPVSSTCAGSGFEILVQQEYLPEASECVGMGSFVAQIQLVSLSHDFR